MHVGVLFSTRTKSKSHRKHQVMQRTYISLHVVILTSLSVSGLSLFFPIQSHPSSFCCFTTEYLLLKIFLASVVQKTSAVSSDVSLWCCDHAFCSHLTICLESTCFRFTPERLRVYSADSKKREGYKPPSLFSFTTRVHHSDDSGNFFAV